MALTGFFREGVMESFRIPVKAVNEKEKERGEICLPMWLPAFNSDVSWAPQVHPWDKNPLSPEGHFPSVLTTRRITNYLKGW